MHTKTNTMKVIKLPKVNNLYTKKNLIERMVDYKIWKN